MSEPKPKPKPRHRLTTRIWHWVNALSLLVLLMSGLSIFNAHPRLYWGEYGAHDDYAWMAVGSSPTQGYLRFGETRINTTGILGNWRDSEGQTKTWAFPGWATLPSYYSLAEGRRWHFFFAWIFSVALMLFLLRSLWNRHIQRDLHIRRAEWRWSNIWQDIKDDVTLRFPKGEDIREYNVLQKITYAFIIFLLLPMMILTGLTMSPAMDANWPILSDIFGGRQSARSIHFICAFTLVLVFLAHFIMVLLSGPVHQIRAMITGGGK
ncbi:Thiosulfate reductase cytochrome B subunit (membrane anchoring protein) [hydrothermal vent metagenome]|uniref:Thiosulfate reductase cytochrome B subunit (Membrane anchoring protein) n=1 Tax=hydrothermal vent metagenome TaxID=652676 RepID=A0A3B0R8C3_9ZZZZ